MRLETAQPSHIWPYAQTMTLQEKKNDNKHTGRWITTHLEIMIGFAEGAAVLLDYDGTPCAFFGVERLGKFWLSIHPRFYEAQRDYAKTVRPAYAYWQERHGDLIAYVRRRDANAVRWYDEVGFVEPSTAIFHDDYLTGPLIRVPLDRL